MMRSRGVYKTVSSYIGSKNQHIGPILSLKPKWCTAHLEPYMGMSNVILNSECEERIGNDIDKRIYNLWKHIIEHGEETYERLLELDETHLNYNMAVIMTTLMFDEDNQNEIRESDLLTCAVFTWYLLLTTRSGDMQTYLDKSYQKSYSEYMEDGTNVPNMKRVKNYRKRLLIVYDTLELAKGIEMYNEDAVTLIERYKGREDVYAVLDPPYYNKKGLYKYNYYDDSGRQFSELAHMLEDTKNQTILFDYENPYYDEILLNSTKQKWYKEPFATVKKTYSSYHDRGKVKGTATEIVWTNFKI